MSGELDTLFKLGQLSEMIRSGDRQDEQMRLEREKFSSFLVPEVARQSQANSFMEIDKLLDKNGITGPTDEDLSSRKSFSNFTSKIKDPLLKNLLTDRYDNITKQNYILGKDSYTQEVDNNYKKSATSNQYSNANDLSYKRLAYDKNDLLNKQFGIIADKINKQKIIIMSKKSHFR